MEIQLYKPGFERPRGGELAAEDCLLDGYHGVIDMWASIRGFVGEVAPDINFGVAVVDIRLGEAEVDIILGVASGVRRGVMCDERAYFWIRGLVAVPNWFFQQSKRLKLMLPSWWVSRWIINDKLTIPSRFVLPASKDSPNTFVVAWLTDPPSSAFKTE